MLKVTDDGVKIHLQSSPTANPLLGQIIITAIVVAIVGGLMALGVLPSLWGALLIVLVVIGGYVWQMLQKKSTSPTLTGGELILTPKTLTHQHFGKTIQYQLTHQDSVHIQNNSIAIHDGQGKTLYQIHGFSDPKHLQVAQAVLQGKQIKTQGKAIKMQSTH